VKFNSTEHTCFCSQVALSVYYAFEFFLKIWKKTWLGFLRGGPAAVLHTFIMTIACVLYILWFLMMICNFRQLGRKLEAFCCFLFQYMKTNLSSGVPRGLLCVFEFLLSNCRVVGIKECSFFVWGFNMGGMYECPVWRDFWYFCFDGAFRCTLDCILIRPTY